MNAAATESHLYRSEAFAEDVFDLVSEAPVIEPVPAGARWLVNAVPVAVALLGVAFAVVPPLG
ncbi:MAG: hypothetical protein V4792_17390 [Pseudomonadota bacterium]